MQKAAQNACVVFISQQSGWSVPGAAIGFYVRLSLVLAVALELSKATLPVSRMRTWRPRR